MRRRIGTIALFVAAGACSACCKPRIKQFDATPPILCSDETTELRWKASGDVVMQLTIEPTPVAGEACIAVGRQTLDLTLVPARNGEEGGGWPIQIIQLQAGATEPVAYATTSIDRGDVLAGGEKNLELWVRNKPDARRLTNEIVVTSVVACDGRRIEVTHAGRTASLTGDGRPSTDFDGTLLGGDWELRSPLTAKELEDPHSRPKELKILASIKCRKERR